MTWQTGANARIGIAGTLECRDAAGAIVKTIDIQASIPLEALGLTAEQTEQLVNEGAAHGADHCE